GRGRARCSESFRTLQITGGRNDVVFHPDGAHHGAQPPSPTLRNRGRSHLGNRLTEAAHPYRFASAPYTLQYFQASGLEFRYRNLFHFHSESRIASTMVNNYGQL